jgi:ubiquinone/menaquinone biosynthesis C-methylase UbiE
MLERVLEPEVMDSPEEARDYDAMDHTAVNRVFVVDFLAAWTGKGTILDVGTGTAQIPIELCRHSPTAEVIAIDMAEHMLATGRTNVCQAGLEKRITLRLEDAKRLSFAAGRFAAVISNSIVHHIPDPGPVLTEMVRVLQPGATLFVRDLLRPRSTDELARLVAAYAGAANAHQQQMFADSLHAALNLAEIRDLVARLDFDAGEVRQTSDRHWTWFARKK